MKNEFRKNFEQMYRDKLASIKNDKYFFEREYISVHNFKTKNSSDIKNSLMMMAYKLLDRDIAVKELLKYVKYPHIAIIIEKGLFEFSLINVTINKLQHNMINMIYMDKLYDLCGNLDIDDKKIDNKTLLNVVMQSEFDSYFLSFLSPEQLHPKRWSDIVLKKQLQYDTVNNLQTTDIYKCSKCGERKFKITEIQLRSADEPVSRFHTCMVCHNTFIK